MVDAVIFDIGGVLELTPPTGHTELWERRLGLEPGGMDRAMFDVWRAGSLGSISEQQVRAALSERMGLSEADVEEYMTGVWEEYLGSPNTELIDYFRSLRGRCRTGIVSNSFVGAREREREAYGFEDMTDVIVYSHEAGVAKPDPDIYLLACRQLDVAPDRTVFVDDRPGAVDGARAVGMTGVLFRDNAQVIAEIEASLRAR